MTARARAFSQVDVFGTEPYSGNPVPVILDGSDLSDEAMTRFTCWTNLSEATFVLPPTHADADYRVRIFTSASETAARSGLGFELPFAGHPTLGTCHAWLEAGSQPRNADTVVQECGAGLVPIRRTAETLAFAAPPLIRSGPVEETLVASIAASLRIDRAAIVEAAWVDNGPGWVAVLLESAEAVLALEPGFVENDLGVVGPLPAGSSESLEVRAFFPRNGATTEDPVTGSLNASLAQWLIRDGRVSAAYSVRQGTRLGRAGKVDIARDESGVIWVGGTTITCVHGQVVL